ncbi:hypothetical protein C1J03_12745 [Sulfitobacter sp. SK012]|nr:hypothetical protein C1J03_12745 [Sulfitobacter sp. SK012]
MDGWGIDSIQDFEITPGSSDRIDLRNVSRITDFDDLIDTHLREVNGTVFITDQQGNSIRFNGVTLAELQSSEDFYIF